MNPRNVERLERHLLREPQVGQGVYIAKGAVVVGDVSLGDHSSVWYGAVLRGDINRIEVGRCSNIQDNAVVHLADDFPCIIGNYVTIGHSAIVHACTVEDECLIGMGAIVLDGAVIGSQSIVGANSLVPMGMVAPPGSMILGTPARIHRQLSPAERELVKGWAEKYVDNAKFCLERGIQIGKPLI
ncbi:MAG: gamma carbonic anhydrase family protein [Verrucomicrobiales bacterium]